MPIFFAIVLISGELSCENLQETLMRRFGCRWPCNHRRVFDWLLFHNLNHLIQKCANDLFHKYFLALKGIDGLDGREGDVDVKLSEKSLILCIL